MKTIFLTLALLIISFAQGQDFSFMATANNADQANALQIAQNIASNAETKYRLYKATENKKQANYRVVYAPVAMTDEQIADQFSFANCIVVDFTVQADGSYKLREVTANYKDLFPSWQRYFNPNVKADVALNDTNSRILEDPAKKVHFRMQKNPSGSDWKIYNRS